MKKRLLSTVIAFAMIIGCFSCLGTVTSFADAPIDITSSLTMSDLGGAIADTTTIAVSFGGYSSLPESGAGYFHNDNPTSNGIDPMEYFYINGKSAREIVTENQTGVTSYTGSAFPMNIGGVYSPVMAFCEEGYIRFSILNSYLAGGSYLITFKSGFTWKNNNGQTLVVNGDINYAYNKDGAFSKVNSIVDTNSALSVVNYITDTGNEYTYIDITSTLSQFTGYDFKFLDTPFGSGGFLPYLEINGRTLAEINATDISGYNTTWTVFPATADAKYQVAVLPLAESGTAVKLKVLKAWLNDFITQNDGELSITIKSGFRSFIDGTLYMNSEDKIFNFDSSDSSWNIVNEVKPEIFSVTKGNIIPTADYVNVGINMPNSGPTSSIGYHFSEVKSSYPDVSTNIFINGKSVYDINEDYDGSYTYTEFPATAGRAYQDPVYLFAESDGLLWVKIAKPYFRTLPAEFNVSFGKDMSYYIGTTEYRLDEETEFTVEKSGRENAKWFSYDSSADYGISVFNNSTSPEGYQSFNLVYSSNVADLGSIGYDSGNPDYYAMQEKIFINGKSVAQINAETSTAGYSFGYFPASAIDSFKLPVIIYVSGENMELKINSAYYNTVKDDFSLVIKPDFFVVVNGVRYCMPDGFTYIANKAKRQPVLLGGNTEFLDVKMDSDFFASAPVGTVFSPVGGEAFMHIREQNNDVSTFGALTLQKMENDVYRINLLNANVVDGATVNLDGAYMNGTDIEHVGPVSFIYRNGWYNLMTSNSIGNVSNMLSNGKFDDSISGWTLANAADSVSLSAEGFSGNGVAVTHSGSNGSVTNSLSSSSFAVEKGKTYRVYAHVFANGRVSLGLTVKNGSAKLASTDNFTALRDGTDGWKLMEYKFTANANASVTLSLDQQFTGTDATVIYDDVIVCKDFGKGDIDGNGSIDIIDLVRYKKVLANQSTFADITTADINGDNERDSTDIIYLVKLLLGIDIKGYTYNKQSNGTALYFGSSDNDLNTFLNDFFDRNTGANNSTALRPGEIGYANTAWKAWEAQSLLWYDSTDTNFSTDKFEYMRQWLYGTPIDSYGYVWSSFNNLEDPATNPSGVFGMGWPFPNYGAQKDYDWEFNSSSKDNWKVTGAASNSVANGFFKTSVSGATELTFSNSSYSAIINTAEAPFLEFDLRWGLNAASVDDIIVSWKTSAVSSNWKSTSVKEYSIMEQTFGKDYAEHIYLPLYLNSDWGNNKSIYGLKITVKAKSGASLTGNINLNFVRGNLDTRQIDNAYNLLETAKLYQEYTGDLKTLKGNLNRYRSAVMFMAYNLADNDGLINLSNFVGHDGGIRTDSRNHTIASSYWDLISLSPKSVYAQALYYKCLEDLAYLEDVAEKNGITVAAPSIRSFDGNNKTYSFTSTTLENMANTVKTAVEQPVNTSSKTGYFDESKGRFIEGFNRNGDVVDYGSVIFNNMVVSFGMATDSQAQAVLSWINGDRIVSGDNSTGADIYAYDFAPRTTTVKNSTQYVSDYSSAEANSAFGTYCQDGGAILFTSYYDIMSRLAYSGTEDAYDRLSDIKDWYLKILEAYNNNGGSYDMRNFFRGYYANKGVTLQGDGTSGALGLDKEFIENTILCSVVSDGFFGIKGEGNTLSVSPALPDELSYWRMENLMFHKVKYDLEIGKDYVILESVDGNAYGLSFTANIKTDKANPKVYVNGVELDSSKYSVSNGVVSVTTNFGAEKIEIK